ncbi:MAG TPA: RNA polymerase sigma factor region1.1 domain-containing protein, partial [Caulobacteraceae bacterium]
MSQQAETPEAETTSDGPLLDLTDAGVKKFIKQAKARGYVTMDELNKVMPSEEVSPDAIEDTLAMLSEMGVNVIEAEEEAEQQGGEVATREETQVVAEADAKPTYDRTDDPVRMYLREMGSVELLSREGEIAIAKRIEAGRDTMIRGLCESALTFEAIMVWREELASGRILLREVIDLDGTYGVVHAGDPGVPGEPGGPPLPGSPEALAAEEEAAALAANPPPEPEPVEKPEGSEEDDDDFD